jgi:hypothetical protein
MILPNKVHHLIGSSVSFRHFSRLKAKNDNYIHKFARKTIETLALKSQLTEAKHTIELLECKLAAEVKFRESDKLMAATTLQNALDNTKRVEDRCDWYFLLVGFGVNMWLWKRFFE